MLDKEGWIEGGAEWLFLSSNLTPLFTQEQFLIADNNVPLRNVDTFVNDRKYVNPSYNSGFSLFFRYRASTDNDLTVNYSYLRNNGTGSYKVSTPDNTVGDQTFSTAITNDDRANLHSHMHVFDVMAGRQLPINYQMFARLSGGFSVSDFHMFFQFSDYDITDFTSLPNPSILNSINTHYKEHHRFWGIGPKGQFDFEFMMLPSNWNHSLNFSFWTQFALLFGRDWSNGKNVRTTDTNITAPTRNINTEVDPWRSNPKFLLIPNFNLDIGLKYRWESSFQDMIFNLAVGYRVYTYWNMDMLFTGRYLTPGGTRIETNNDEFVIDLRPTRQNIDNVDHLIYAGPYIRASLAY